MPVPVLVQAAMHAHKPRDAFIVIGYTMEDICNSRSGFGFLFGEANLDLSVGLFSFARYADDVPRASPRFLRRCGMVLCHEAGHLFGVKHCVCAAPATQHLHRPAPKLPPCPLPPAPLAPPPAPHPLPLSTPHPLTPHPLTATTTPPPIGTPLA